MAFDQKATGGFNASTETVHRLDPERFSHGQWDHDLQRDIGEGDIAASYSADVIAMKGIVRKPFLFQRRLWVSTGNRTVRPAGPMNNGATAYHLMPLEAFEGRAVSYAEKTADSGAARADPNGFYHRITVRHRGQPHVMVGPPVHFVPGPPKPPMQPGLFDLPPEQGLP